MNENELIALLAAVVWGSDRGGKYNLGYVESVEAAQRIMKAAVESAATQGIVEEHEGRDAE